MSNLLNALKEVKQIVAKGGFKKDGICVIIRNICHKTYEDTALTLRQKCAKWEHFSGAEVYPIPCPKGGWASLAYTKAEKDGKMWDKRTKYGKLRHELLDFLIEELENDNDKNTRCHN